MTGKTAKARRAKRVPIEAGDIILLPQSNGKHTLACVIGLWPKLRSVMTIALFSKEVAKEELRHEDLPRLVADQIAKRQFIAVLSTTTGTAQVGEWPKIGAVTNLEVDELLPEIPFRTGSLVGAEHHSARLVESLVDAYRGLVSWEKPLPGRPGYLKSLLFESPSLH